MYWGGGRYGSMSVRADESERERVMVDMLDRSCIRAL